MSIPGKFWIARLALRVGLGNIAHQNTQIGLEGSHSCRVAVVQLIDSTQKDWTFNGINVLTLVMHSRRLGLAALP
jgi:hypothetical protein